MTSSEHVPKRAECQRPLCTQPTSGVTHAIHVADNTFVNVCSVCADEARAQGFVVNPLPHVPAGREAVTGSDTTRQAASSETTVSVPVGERCGRCEHMLGNHSRRSGWCLARGCACAQFLAAEAPQAAQAKPEPNDPYADCRTPLESEITRGEYGFCIGTTFVGGPSEAYCVHHGLFCEGLKRTPTPGVPSDDELRALIETAEKATQGGWGVRPDGDDGPQQISPGYTMYTVNLSFTAWCKTADAAFIVNANPTVVSAMARELLEARQTNGSRPAGSSVYDSQSPKIGDRVQYVEGPRGEYVIVGQDKGGRERLLRIMLVGAPLTQGWGLTTPDSLEPCTGRDASFYAELAEAKARVRALTGTTEGN